MFPRYLESARRTAENALARPRMALAGAVVLALAHYTFGEWVFHPGLAWWRQPAFWVDVPWAAAIPALNWFAWVCLSLGRVNAARAMFLIYAVVCVGDSVWFSARHCAALIGVKLSPDDWYWWTHWLPAVLVLGNALIARQWRQEINRSRTARLRRQLTRLEAGLRFVAALSGGWAALLTVIHLLVPRLPANDFTLALADDFLVRPEHRADFAFVLQTAPCRGRRLGAVLQHVELASVQRKQFYPELDTATFQRFILSPIVETMPLAELDWRRTLWEYFHPRIRREHEPLGAARIVVRFLRERVGISPDYPYCVGAETIWTQGMTDAAGFERIYVAALRSVGIAARVNDRHQAELLADGQWQAAPRPLATTW